MSDFFAAGPSDPAAFAAEVGIFVGVTCTAALVPALRAMGVDLLAAPRWE